MLEGDHEHIAKRVLSQLMVNTTRENEDANTVYPLDNGDAFVPPSYLGRTFPAPHNHYRATEGPFDTSDLEWALDTISEHGYGTTPGSQLLVFANRAESKVIQRFKSGVAAADGALSSYDFIPSAGAPAYLTDKTIIGERPPESYDGLKVAGSYGAAWLIETPFVSTAVGFREHKNTAYQGLRPRPPTVPNGLRGR